VLEYYSFLTNKKQITQLRHDTALSENDFAKRILDLISKDEKGPLLKLINLSGDATVAQQAFAAGFIQNENIGLLGEAIYAFRNSIVHGKNSHGYDLQSTSILADNPSLPVWRALLQALAKKVMHSFGSKLV
jgi:hypothetical protein